MRSDNRVSVWLTSDEPASHADSRPELVAHRRVADTEDLPPEPYDLSAEAICLVTTVERSTMRDCILAAARGVPMVLRCVLTSDERAGFLDELRRLAAVTEPASGEGTADSLPPDHIALLSLLAGGSSVTQAGRELGLSRRTAYRRLDEAKTALAAGSTVDAVQQAIENGLVRHPLQKRRS